MGQMNNQCFKVAFIPQAITTTGYVAISGAILFIAANRLSWFVAWLYLVAYLIFLLSTLRIALLHPPHLKRKDAPAKWERPLYHIFRLTHPATLALAGLEFEANQYTASFSPIVQGSAFIILLLVYVLLAWTQKTNPYYHEPIPDKPRWQQEIIQTGPYAIVRHPGYLGMLLLALLRPIVLGSYWALLPAFIGVVAMYLRTVWEDKALQDGVEGYDDYAKLIKSRLFQNIW